MYPNKYIIYILISVCCLAMGGIFVKISSLGPINTGMYRILFSLPFLFFVMKKNYTFHFKGINLLIAILSGFFLAFDLILWNISFSLTTVSNANLLANLVPFTVVPLSYFLYKEKVSNNFLIGLTIVVIGLFFLFRNKISLNLYGLKGDILAYLTSIFYGLFIITIYKLRKEMPAIPIMFYSGIGSFFILLIFSFSIEGLQFPISIKEFYPLFGLAIVSQIGGQVGLSYCLGKIPAYLASILVLFQPIVSAIYAYLFFGEKISYVEIIGMVIILIGVFFSKK